MYNLFTLANLMAQNGEEPPEPFSVSRLLNQVWLFIPKFITGLVVIFIFWVVALIIKSVVRRILDRTDLNQDVAELIQQGIKISILALGIVSGLGTMGVDVLALVASLGLVGFALGFALKDAVSNTLAGVLILAYHPFRRGDHIKVGGNEGEVIEIDLRYTTLDTEEQRILVPNSQLFSNAVTVKKPSVPPPPPQ